MVTSKVNTDGLYYKDYLVRAKVKMEYYVCNKLCFTLYLPLIQYITFDENAACITYIYLFNRKTNDSLYVSIV